MKNNYLLIFGVVFLLSIFCKGTLNASRSMNHISFGAVDTILTSQVSDSVAAILLDASSVTVTSLKDTTSVKPLVCNKEQKAIVKFVFSTLDFERPNYVIFGQFKPYVVYKFVCQKQCFTIAIDFGLKQFKLYDAENHEIGNYIYNDKSLLKLSAIFFPNDEFINFMLKQE